MPETVEEPPHERAADQEAATETLPEPGFTGFGPQSGAEPSPAESDAAPSTVAEEPPPPIAEEAPMAAPEPEVPPSDVEPPPFDDDTASQFDPEPPFRKRRNTLRLWTYAAVVFALFAGGTIVAVSYWGLPDWVPVSRPTFAVGQQDLQLDFPPDRQERRQLPNGTEYFSASGSITNTGSEARNVPTILIVLRDERERIVYSLEVDPPKRTLAPGESVNVNEAVTDVPRAAKFAEIGWKPE